VNFAQTEDRIDPKVLQHFVEHNQVNAGVADGERFSLDVAAQECRAVDIEPFRIDVNGLHFVSRAVQGHGENKWGSTHIQDRSRRL